VLALESVRPAWRAPVRASVPAMVWESAREAVRSLAWPQQVLAQVVDFLAWEQEADLARVLEQGLQAQDKVPARVRGKVKVRALVLVKVKANKVPVKVKAKVPVLVMGKAPDQGTATWPVPRKDSAIRAKAVWGKVPAAPVQGPARWLAPWKAHRPK